MRLCVRFPLLDPARFGCWQIFWSVVTTRGGSMKLAGSGACRTRCVASIIRPERAMIGNIKSLVSGTFTRKSVCGGGILAV